MVKNKDEFIFNIDDIRVPTKWLKDKELGMMEKIQRIFGYWMIEKI